MIQYTISFFLLMMKFFVCELCVVTNHLCGAKRREETNETMFFGERNIVFAYFANIQLIQGEFGGILDISGEGEEGGRGVLTRAEYEQ